MPYVARDQAGAIISVSKSRTDAAAEHLPVDDDELAAFLARTGGEELLQSEFDASDLEFVRVIEDVIAVLIDKGVLMMTDLPSAAQNKLMQRYRLRSKLTDLGGIVSQDDDLIPLVGLDYSF